MKKVIIYTRPGCHLCEIAKDIVLDLQGEINFEFQEVDINSSDDLTEKYGLMIPVVEVEGEIVQFGQIVKNTLKLALQAKNIG